MNYMYKYNEDYFKITKKFVTNEYKGYQNDPSENFDVYSTIRSSLKKWNIDSDNIDSFNYSEERDYRRMLLQIHIDLEFAGEGAMSAGFENKAEDFRLTVSSLISEIDYYSDVVDNDDIFHYYFDKRQSINDYHSCIKANGLI